MLLCYIPISDIKPNNDLFHQNGILITLRINTPLKSCPLTAAGDVSKLLLTLAMGKNKINTKERGKNIEERYCAHDSCDCWLDNRD